jgi:competence protein ComEA
MSQKFSEAFQFNKGQRRAIFLLIVLVLLLIFVRFYRQTPSAESYMYDKMAQRIDSFLQSEVNEVAPKKMSNYSSPNKVLLRPFDPNVTSYSTLLSLGFEKHQAKTLLNYLEAGGSFTYKEDLLKLYTIDEDDYQNWAPYILLPDRPMDVSEESEVFEEEDEEFVQTLSIELNEATQVELMEVRGIGPVLSKNILKYRELLGGYQNVDQLREVYGIDSVVFQQIHTSFLVNDDSIKTKNINILDFYQLRKHPYINQKQAFEITNHIKYKGKFKSLEELKELESIKVADYERIYPYFVVQ